MGRDLRRPAALVAALVALLLVLVAMGGGATPAGALDPTIPAPVTHLSADGRTATDGQRSLTVSTVKALDADGTTLEVSGAGYDTFKGIYVAYCVLPPTDQPPTPCGGGADMTGASGASHWISSNPPPQGVGLATPYGAGGSFRVSISVQPTIGPPGSPPIDCRRVRSAVVTRNDHTRSSDRGQDVFVPVTFASASGAGTAPTPTPTTVAPTPTTPAPSVAPATDVPTTTPTTAVAALTTDTTASDGLPLDDEQAIADTSVAGRDASRAANPWLLGGVLALVAALAIGVGLAVRHRARPAP